MDTGRHRVTRGARPARHRLLCLMVALLMVALGARSAPAQSVQGEIVSVGIGGISGRGGMYRAGSWVPVQVRLENRSPGPFVGRLAIEQKDLDGDKTISIGPEFILQPGVEGRLLWTYYWPQPDEVNTGGITSVAVLDKAGQPIDASITTPRRMPGAQMLWTTDQETNRSWRMAVVLGRGAAGWSAFDRVWGGTEAVKAQLVTQPWQLPDDAKGFDCVDVLVWQADVIKVSEIAPEFQLKAMLDWVQAGGHLIISVATQGQEIVQGPARLAEAMPIALTGTREGLVMGDLSTFSLWGQGLGASPGAGAGRAAGDKPLVQAIGTLRPTARVVMGGRDPFADHPLVVTGLYGQGAITVVTLDVTHGEMAARMSSRDWINFWNRVAGWRTAMPPSDFFTAEEFEREQKNQQGDPAVSAFQVPLVLGREISSAIDVTEVTAVRILVAVLFLALYWLVAGPLGHLAMRSYKLVHWSWWIFGATVVAATALAGGVVLLLHVATIDLRHKSFVLGTVNRDEATVTGFYGVYAPVSGQVRLALPQVPGIGYLAPLCMPTTDAVRPFADPQSYQIRTDQPCEIWPVFRSTLKKMQARWHGPLPGIRGAAAYGPDARHLLRGTLTNHSGYDLERVDIVVHVPWTLSSRTSPQNPPGHAYLYHVGQWKNGQTIDLEQALQLDELEIRKVSTARGPGTLSTLLQVLGWSESTERFTGGFGPIAGQRPKIIPSEQQTALAARVNNRGDLGYLRGQLLYLLLDERDIDDMHAEDRREAVRGVGRLTDCSKMLRAAGALIVAQSGSIGDKALVPSPLELTVNDRKVDGKGEILFAWALPVTGQPPAQLSLPDGASLLAPLAPGAGGGQGHPDPIGPQGDTP